MVVGIVGAFLTAAYMTRCVYLTFFGEYRGGHPPHGHDPQTAADAAEAALADELHDQGAPAAADLEPAHASHGHAIPGFGSGPGAHDIHDPHDQGAHAHEGPHESPPLITVPLWILAFAAFTAGWLQWETAPFRIAKFREWFEPRVAFPTPEMGFPEVGFQLGLAAISIGVALLGFGAAYLFYWRKAYGQDATARPGPLRAGKAFLVDKLYLDALYTDVVVGTVKGAIARAAYWINQHVIDGVLRNTGRTVTGGARIVYRYVDQDAVDGAYNGAAVVTADAGGLARLLQSGRLQEYALFIVVAVAFVAVGLTIAF